MPDAVPISKQPEALSLTTGTADQAVACLDKCASLYNRLWVLVAWGRLESIPSGLRCKGRAFGVAVGSDTNTRLQTGALSILGFSRWRVACQHRPGWLAWPDAAWNAACVWELRHRRPGEGTPWWQEEAAGLPGSFFCSYGFATKNFFPTGFAVNGSSI